MLQGRDYSRDLRPAKWGLGVSLHGSYPEPRNSLWIKKRKTSRRAFHVRFSLDLIADISESPLCAKKSGRDHRISPSLPRTTNRSVESLRLPRVP